MSQSIVILSALKDNYIYLLPSLNNSYIAIDPGDSCPVINFLESQEASLSTILITHSHLDHTGGVSELKKKYDCEIIEPKPLGGVIHLPPYHFEILPTPGHTSDHVSYYEPKRGWLFCGDTLFCAGCGRVFSSTPQNLYESLKLLAQLPERTLVYAAHEYTLENIRFALNLNPNDTAIKQALISLKEKLESNSPTLPSKIGLEKLINPFLRIESSSYRHSIGLKNFSEEEAFIYLRDQKDRF